MSNVDVLSSKGKLASFFGFYERGATYRVEVLAGLTTFVTMVYVLFLQPLAIVGGAEQFVDINGVVVTKSAILILTALVSGLTTIFMGFFTNFPFALSTGMGINFYLGGMLQGGAISFGGIMAINFVAGLIFIALSVLGIRTYIVELIPKNIKIAIGSAIGFFLAYLGFQNSGICTFSNGISIGDFTSMPVMLSIVGLLLIIALEVNKVTGGILISVLVVTVAGIPLGVTNIPSSLSLPNFKDVSNIVFQLDFKALMTPAMVTIIFATFFGDFFSTLGTVLGLGGRLNMLDREGNLPGIKKPFIVDSIATTFGSLFGCTVITTFVESASGVEAGGKTGFSSIVTGILFLASLVIAPFVLIIPTAATAPVLIYIGFIMVREIAKVDFSSVSESVAPFMTIAFTIFAADFAAGIAAGVISYVLINISTGKAKDVKLGLYILSVFLVFYFIV